MFQNLSVFNSSCRLPDRAVDNPDDRAIDKPEDKSVDMVLQRVSFPEFGAGCRKLIHDVSFSCRQAY